jgi:uncharacterized protein YutE (UPF0331/DUF86 family)
MVKKDLVTAKLAELAQRTARVVAKRPSTISELETNADTLDIVSFNLMLAVQLCADIASHITADENWKPAKSLAEGFTRLLENGVIRNDTAEALKRAVGLRNVVAHGYGHVDANSVFVAATRGVTDLSNFASEVAQWLTSRP